MIGEGFEAIKERYWIWACLAETDGTLNEFAAEQYDLHKDDIVTVAALVTVLNHKCWYWHERRDYELSQIYARLYEEYNSKAWDWLEKHGSDEEKTWYFQTMD